MNLDPKVLEAFTRKLKTGSPDSHPEPSDDIEDRCVCTLFADPENRGAWLVSNSTASLQVLMLSLTSNAGENPADPKSTVENGDASSSESCEEVEWVCSQVAKVVLKPWLIDERDRITRLLGSDNQSAIEVAQVDFKSLQAAIAQSTILRRSDLGAWLAVPLIGIYYFSDLVLRRPSPPRSIIEDWKAQLKQLQHDADASPVQTLVTESGLLFPLNALATAARESVGSIGREVAPFNDAIRLGLWKPTLVEWPWLKRTHRTKPESGESLVCTLNEDAQSGFDEADLSPSFDVPVTSNSSLAARTSVRTKKPIAVYAGICTIAVALIGLVTWVILSTSSSDSRQSAKAEMTEDAPNRPALTSSLSATSMNASSKNADAGAGGVASIAADSSAEVTSSSEAEVNSELVTTDLNLLGTEPSPSTQQPSLDSFLSSIKLSKPKLSKPSVDSSSASEDPKESNDAAAVESITPDEIVSQSLQAARESTASQSLTQSTTEDSSDESTSVENGSDDESVDALEKVETVLKLKVAAAFTQERTRLKQKVSPKKSACQAKLSLGENADEDIVMSPKESVSIQGIGMTRWRVAFEDKDPELVVELKSLPSNRWQVSMAVGVKYNSDVEPVPIGPGDARMVGERLLAYHQWLEQSITMLRNAPRRRGVNVFGQIQSLQAQQKETEKSLKQWETIARLANDLFSSGEVTIELEPAP